MGGIPFSQMTTRTILFSIDSLSFEQVCTYGSSTLSTPRFPIEWRGFFFPPFFLCLFERKKNERHSTFLTIRAVYITTTVAGGCYPRSGTARFDRLKARDPALPLIATVHDVNDDVISGGIDHLRRVRPKLLISII